VSNSKRAKRVRQWRLYQAKCDRLVAHQSLTSRIQHPMHTTPGFFRAEGWPTDRYDLRHGV
jgi:hypothetical protein